MPKPYDTKLILMVAQQSFESDLNRFSKLIPIVYVDGTLANEHDFENDGEVWWMLTAQTAQLSQPGLLVAGFLENATGYDPADETSSKYQVKRNSVQMLDQKDGMNVIEIDGDGLNDIQEVVSAGFRLELSIRPTPSIMLSWQSYVYGPFVAIPDLRGNLGGGRLRFSLSPSDSAHMTVYRIEKEVFDRATTTHRLSFNKRVSDTSHRRSETESPVQVSHCLLLGTGFDRLRALCPHVLAIEPIDRKLMRYAKQCLTRPRRQAFRELLEELAITGSETEDAQDLLESISRVGHTIEKQEAALDEVAKAMLGSGLLGVERIGKAEQAFAERYIQEQTAELQSKIEESLVIKRADLRRIEGELKDIQSKFNREEIQARAKLDQELANEKEKAQRAMAAERVEFEKQKAELLRQQNALEENLQKVITDLRDTGDEVVNRFLTIAPLLQGLGWAGGQVVFNASSSEKECVVEAQPESFALPGFVTNAPPDSNGHLNENIFFERFLRVVEESGFRYRPIDLQRFHLSVKCGEMTVLGGPSGTGKSSLPALYAQALLGDEYRNGRPGCLMVNVNPTWMDRHDLLGHMNTLEGRFYPAESGLFQHLIFAQEEHQARGTASGAYLVCLDEMNLSQVEHYFSDFMMVIERSGSARMIQCFAPSSSRDKCPFKPWARLTFSPALRFVGTVNFDETTRSLSDRFLDRVNLIRLRSEGLPVVAGTDKTMAVANGKMITLADFESWVTADALPSELGALLDHLRPLLNRMGCPVSPRVYRAICRFVGSSSPIMSPTKAFDVQVAQRIVPKIRSLIAAKQLDALDDLARILKESSVCSFDESVPLIDEIRDSAQSRDWESVE